MTEQSEADRPNPAMAAWAAQENWRAHRLGRGRRVFFASIFLVYLAQTASGIDSHANGWLEVLGFVLLAAFVAAYLFAMPMMWAAEPDRRIWTVLVVMVVLYAAVTPIAHMDAYVMAIFISVIVIQSTGRYWAPLLVLLTVTAMLVPPLVPTWHQGVNWSAAVSIPLVAGIMFGFFRVTEANRAMADMRAEVVRLAAESERNRIARDLHDVLGHSLTTITVKSALAARLAERDPRRAQREIAEVEELARQALTDVRATVDGYREVTLAGELATGREMLRATGILGDLPHSTDPVRGELQGLFGWVLREALTNIVRHSRATSCTVTWGASWIEVVDNGSAEFVNEGNGLRGMRERVEAVGGTLMAGRADGGGWRLHVDVPESVADPGDAADGRSSNGDVDGDEMLGEPTGSLDDPSVRTR
jgi:two-component system sensor histidine kinase DesK